MPEELKLINQDRFSKLQKDFSEAKDRDERLIIARRLLDLISSSSGSIVNQLQEGVTVTNFDEVRAALANELRRNTKVLSKVFNDMKVSNDEQADIMAKLDREVFSKFEGEFQTIRIKRPRDLVHVINFDQMEFPTRIGVNNFDEVNSKLDELIQAFNIEIPTPQVTVQPTPVNVDIPETNINIPEANFEPIVDAIIELRKSIKNSVNSSNNRAFGKLLDGLGTKLDNLGEAMSRVFVGFPGVFKLQNAKGTIISPAESETAISVGSDRQTVTTAGTAVQLQNHNCKWVILTAETNNTNPITYGGSDVVAAEATRKGVPLFTAQGSGVLKVNNTNTIWIDAITDTEGVTYAFGS